MSEPGLLLLASLSISVIALAIAAVSVSHENMLGVALAVVVWLVGLATIKGVGARHAKAARALETESDLAKLASALESGPRVVREAAAARFAALTSPVDLVARARDLVSRKTAEAIESAGLLARSAGEARAVEVALPIADALVALASDSAATPLARYAAQDALDDVPAPREKVAAFAREALARASELPTIELVSILGVSGEPSDAALLAPFAAAESFPVASAACAAIQTLLERGKPGDLASLTKNLKTAREKLRGVHPEGDNPLADELVECLEDLESDLAGGAA